MTCLPDTTLQQHNCCQLDPNGGVLVRVSTSVKRHHNSSKSYKTEHLIGQAFSSELWSIIVIAGHESVQANMKLEKELRALHLDPQATGSKMRHWVWLGHI